MAEGLLGALIGEEPEAPEDEAAIDNLIGASAYAAAVVADGARHDPAVARSTIEFLRDQAHLLRVQIHCIQDEHNLRVQQLRDQLREGRIRRIGQRMRVITQILTTLAVGALSVGVLVMLSDALNSRNVIVDAFQTPAVLAPRGVTGQAVAGQVLDALQRLQDATRTVTKGLHSHNAWSSDLKIEVPETGVSIGEIDRMLHERLGHDVHIDGELIQTDTGGLSLTVRGDAVPPKTFAGAAGDLEKLSNEAAEYIYGRSQPYQFASYLDGNGRYQDALAFVPGAFARADNDALRAHLASVWGAAYNSLGQPESAAEKYRLAMSLTPPRTKKWWNAWGNLLSVVGAAQGEEAAWRESRALLAAADRAAKQEKPELAVLVNPATITWNLPLALSSELADTALHGGAGATTVPLGPQIADTYGLMHDPTNAARYLAASDPDDPSTKAETFLLAAYAALDKGDAAAAIPPLEGLWKAWQADSSVRLTFPDAPCLLGLAYGRAGRLPEAKAVFKQMGPLSRCAAAQGEALARAGDISGAQAVWAQGLARAPDLPLIYLTRGDWDMWTGYLGSAEADIAHAAALAPGFADPLKDWGDLLMRQNRPREALAKYTAALQDAPAWQALRQARDAAAAKVRQLTGGPARR
jgi:tetratricopeptide (TPR) repeat protein